MAENRFKQAVRVIETFELAAIPPFLPVAYTGINQMISIGFGPLIEKNGRDFVILDGLHRSLGAYKCGLKCIYGAIIDAQYMPPPVGALCRLESVKASRSLETQTPLFEGKGIANFRPGREFAKKAESIIMNNMKENNHEK